MITEPAIRLDNIAKHFTMHLQASRRLPVVDGVSFDVAPGELVALGGASGSGKSSIMKMIYGNYAISAGTLKVRHEGAMVDMATAHPRQIARMRATTLGYVSQFLRVVPRVPARDIVAEPFLAWGVAQDEARRRAEALLVRLNVPETLWDLPPATFSGGEQQRVNIARGLISDHPILLLDEPTASLDATNRAAVIALIEEKKAKGVAMLGIFHDKDVRDQIADRTIDIEQFAATPSNAPDKAA